MVKQIIDEVLTIHPSDEYSVFIGNELVAEEADYLEDDEIEIYHNKINRLIRYYTQSGQLKMIIEPEGGHPLTIYILHDSDIENVHLRWKIYPVIGATDKDRFIKDSNKKVRHMERRANQVEIPSNNTMELLSDSEEVVEEVVNKSNTKGSIAKMDIECIDNTE